MVRPLPCIISLILNIVNNNFIVVNDKISSFRAIKNPLISERIFFIHIYAVSADFLFPVRAIQMKPIARPARKKEIHAMLYSAKGSDARRSSMAPSFKPNP